MYYSDTDHVTVISPTTAAHYEEGDVRAGVRLGVDIISAASVDLVSAASPTGYHEERHEAETTVGYEAGRGTWIDGTYDISIEPDFETQRLSGAASHEFLNRSLTLALDYTYTTSQFGRRTAGPLGQSRTGHGVEASASAVLSGRLVLDVLYGFDGSFGDLANPYREVKLYAPGAEAHSTAVPEAVPDTRIRQIATVRLRANPLTSLFTQATYRLYADTWGVLAHTVLLRATEMLWGDTIGLTVEARGYKQDAADFYRARYETFPQAPRRRTADKELGPLYTGRAGLHVEYSPPVTFTEALRFGLGGDVLYMRYLDYAFLNARTAALLTFDLTWEL